MSRSRKAEVQTLAVDDIRKSWNGREVLHGVGLSIEEGEVLSILGPNGAGKTTLLRIIAGLVRPDTGSVAVGTVSIDADPRLARQYLGYAAQDIACYPTLPVLDNLLMAYDLGSLGPGSTKDRMDETISGFGLQPLLNERVADLSGGQQRRVHVAMSAIHGPRLLLLDEPTVGVDIEAREEMIQLVQRIAQSGTGVLYSTHYLSEVEQLDAVVLVLAAGRFVARGKVRDLVAEHGIGSAQLRFDRAISDTTRLPNWARLEPDGSTIHAERADIESAVPELVNLVSAAGSHCTRITMTPATLASVYSTLTGIDPASEGSAA